MGLSKTALRGLLLLLLAGPLAGCDDPQVYGSIGVSSYHGSGYYGGGPRVGGSVVIGGRIR
jgi:hypothetical protein